MELEETEKECIFINQRIDEYVGDVKGDAKLKEIKSKIVQLKNDINKMNVREGIMRINLEKYKRQYGSSRKKPSVKGN